MCIRDRGNGEGGGGGLGLRRGDLIFRRGRGEGRPSAAAVGGEGGVLGGVLGGVFGGAPKKKRAGGKGGKGSGPLPVVVRVGSEYCLQIDKSC